MVVHYNLAAALVANLCGSLLLISIILNSHLLRERSGRRYNKWMAAMIIVCLVGSVSEMVFEVVNGQIFPFSKAINTLAKTLNHSESIFAGFIFVGCMRALIFEDEKRWPTLLRIITILICGVGALLLIGNFFTGVVFTIDENNVYARGPLGQFGLVVSMITLFYTAFILTRGNRNNNTYLRFPVFLYVFPFIVGGGLQMLVPSLRLSSVSFALGIVTAHLSVQRTRLYTDSMTEVYNRGYLDYFFKESAKKGGLKTYGGILLDINSFKEINDNFGHDAGDFAIRKAASILKQTSAKDYLIVRYGGDEFILIREDASMAEILAQKSKINEAVEEFNKTANLPYELSFSIGTTIYEPDLGGVNGFNTFLEQMDLSLFKDKKEYYERTGKERRR